MTLTDDHALDFAYLDGYAHQGNEDGRTLRQWWAKIRPGGLLAGHDYDPVRWPRNVAAVDAFRRDHADQLTRFQLTTDDPFPSWVALKG